MVAVSPLLLLFLLVDGGAGFLGRCDVRRRSSHSPLLARPPSRRSELLEQLDALRPSRLNGTLDAGQRKALRERLERTSRVVRVFAGAQFEKKVFDAFDATDGDGDGAVSPEEVYPVVLQLYILANRQAPVNPPSRAKIAQLFAAADADGSGTLSRSEFYDFVLALLGRTASRIAVFNVVRFAVAPVLATALARELSSNWLFRVEPALVSTLLVVACVAALGNVALAALDFGERLWEAPPEVPILFRDDAAGPVARLADAARRRLFLWRFGPRRLRGRDP